MIESLTAIPTTLALQGWLVGLLTAGFLAVCVILILTVLIQKPQGGGLGGAFGAGAGSGQTAFGARTGDALTLATIFMFVVFVLSAIGLNFASRPDAALPQDDTEMVPVETDAGETAGADGDTTDTEADAEPAPETEAEAEPEAPTEPEPDADPSDPDSGG